MCEHKFAQPRHDSAVTKACRVAKWGTWNRDCFFCSTCFLIFLQTQILLCFLQLFLCKLSCYRDSTLRPRFKLTEHFDIGRWHSRPEPPHWHWKVNLRHLYRPLGNRLLRPTTTHRQQPRVEGTPIGGGELWGNSQIPPPALQQQQGFSVKIECKASSQTYKMHEKGLWPLME